MMQRKPVTPSMRNTDRSGLQLNDVVKFDGSRNQFVVTEPEGPTGFARVSDDQRTYRVNVHAERVTVVSRPGMPVK